MTELKDFSEWLNQNDVGEDNFQYELRNWEKDKLFEVYASEIEHLRQFVRINRIFEFGCGAGFVLRTLREIKSTPFTYLGVDKNPKCISLATSISFPVGGMFVLSDIRNFPSLSSEDEKFDLACSFAVLKHFSLEEFPTILKKFLSYGRYGLFTIQLAVSDIDDGGIGKGANYHHIWLSEKTLKDSVEASGHEITNRKQRWSGTHHGTTGWEEFIITREK